MGRKRFIAIREPQAFASRGGPRVAAILSHGFFIFILILVLRGLLPILQRAE